MYSTIITVGAAGVLLLFLEMFLPGMIAGIIGAGMLVAAVVMAYTDLGAEAGNIALLIAAVVSAGMWWWWANHFQRTRVGKAMTLTAAVEGSSVMAGLEQYAGQLGEAVTPLRPSGTVLIAGKRVDAVTDGDFVNPGEAVKVVRAHGMGLLVRRVS
jgi:membrane-bound serine protease (ClpP class)